MGPTYDVLSRKVGPSMELQALVTSLWADFTVPCARRELRRSERQLTVEQTAFWRAMAELAPDMHNICLHRLEEEALEDSQQERNRAYLLRAARDFFDVRWEESLVRPLAASSELVPDAFINYRSMSLVEIDRRDAVSGS